MISISRKTKILLLTVIMASGIIIASGFFYYRALNLAEDPRVIDARKKMAEYNELMKQNETGLAMLVLDQVEDIYIKTPGYAESYELGVIQNNRGSIFLIKAEKDIINKTEEDTDNLKQAKQYITDSIEIYSRWIETINLLERDDIRKMVLPYFRKDDPAFANLNLEKIIEKRVDDITTSKVETKRRLSVSYTNLGIIYRYESNLEEAGKQYEQALELWPDNHVAQDNLNRLMGLPPEERNIVKQMFFKKRTESP